MTAHYILGVDPGLHGALALYGDADDLRIFDVPTFKVQVGDSLKNQINQAQVAAWLEIHRHMIDFAMVEKVGAMARGGIPCRLCKRSPSQGVTSAFSFGWTAGSISQAIASAGIHIEYVQPVVWKRKFGLIGQGKDASRGAASRILPKHAGQWPLKKHDGRAEAALLAVYGSLLDTPNSFGGTD
jgi:hypothetical protein